MTPENRLAVGRFAKGVTGNPGGRPKGLASSIRERTGNGEDLADKVLHILRHPKGKGIEAQRLQLDCIQWLADRGFGRPVQGVVHGGMKVEPWKALDHISTEDLRAFVEATREAKALR